MSVAHEKEKKPKKRNLICNMRAPDMGHFDRWHEWTAWCGANGYDVCHLTLSLTDAFMKGETATIRNGQKVTYATFNCDFYYQVPKPRREPYSLNCVRPEFRRTFSSVLFEAYVLDKARDMNREFCFRDFLELKYDAFRRIILRLRRKGKIITYPQRTIPQFYILTEKLAEENAESVQHSKTDVLPLSRTIGDSVFGGEGSG